MNVVVSVSLEDSVLAEIDATAQRESRSRSELLHEAVRQYLRHQQRLDTVFAMGDAARERQGLTEKDIAVEIAAARSGLSGQ